MFPWNKFVCNDNDNSLLFEKKYIFNSGIWKIIFKPVLETQVFS